MTRYGGPTYGEFPCPECPRSFKLEGYRRRHIAKAHRGKRAIAATSSGKVVCPECLAPFARRYLAAHLRRAHNVFGGLTGRPRPDRLVSNLPAVIEPAAVKSNGNGAVPRFRQDPNLIVLVDDSGEIWVCERLGGRAH
jgi:hypothetical protein